MSTSTIIMESTTQSTPSRYSVRLETPRPEFSRKRSNSLPAGLANMNAQEAGMLFSAAERAMDRRRRPFSVATPYRIDHTHTRDAPPHVRFDSGATIRPTPPPKDDPVPVQRSSTPSSIISKKQNKPRALRNLDVNKTINARSSDSQLSITKTVPLPKVSPIKRQVTNSSLKSYADGLFQFTQTRLVSTVPNVLSPPPSSTADIFSNTSESEQTETSPSRPRFESQFSDWSIATCESRQSVIHDPVMSRHNIDADLSLMSPDSFFGGFDDTPRRRNFPVKGVDSGYPSSEAYGPQAGDQQPLTPPPCEEEPVVSSSEEFSYFTNYDQYINVDNDAKADIDGATEALENLAIEMSPMESSQFAIISPLSQLKRSNTSLRPPVLSRSCSSDRSGYTYAASTPVTPYHQARVAVSVPHWMIGAIH